MPDSPDTKPIGPGQRLVVLVLFFASGFAALVYEVVWSRLLHQALGATVYAVSAVLAAFMGGMAVGAFVIGRWVDRRRDPLRVFALLELGVLACVAAVPYVLSGLFGPLYGAMFRALGAGHVLLLPTRFMVGAFVVAVPAALMGGTLPVMARLLVRRSGIGITVSALYTVNTLGAVLGSFMAGFVMLPAVGLANTTRFAAAVTLAVAAVAFMLSGVVQRREPFDEAALSGPGNDVAQAPFLSAGQQRLVLVLFGVSGFTALAYEVVWTRLLVFFVQNSTYAFSMMLTVYLLGIALGSALHNVLIRGTRCPARWFFRLELLLALAVAYGLLVAPAVRHVTARIESAPFAAGALTAFLRAAALMLVPTVLLGMIFPVVTALVVDVPRRTGGSVGRAYFANTVGAVLGSILAAFLLVPALGVRVSLVVLACINVLIALGLVASQRRLDPGGRRGASGAWLAVAIVLLVVPVWRSSRSFRTLFLADPDATLAYLDEGVGGTVTVEQYPSHKTISIDGTNVAGTNLAFETTQKLQAHLALLIHPAPKDVLQIGFGSGGTAYSASLHPVERIDCIELMPAIVTAASQFDEANHGVLRDPRVHVAIEDARAVMRHSRQLYDVILSDSTHPIFAGNGALYTVEYFRDCAARLKPGGVFSTWLPVHNLRFEDYTAILRSLRTAFPYVYVWHTAVGRNEWTIVSAFTRPANARNPLSLSYSELERRMGEPTLAGDLATIGFTDPVGLMGLYLLGPAEVDALVKTPGRFNTDDNASIEFVAAHAANNAPREVLFAEAYTKLVSMRPPGAVFLDLMDFDDTRGRETVRRIAQRWWSSNRVLRGRLFELAGQVHRARAEWHRALGDDPANEVARDLLGMTERALDDAKGLTPPAASWVEIGLYHLGHAEEAGEARTAQLEKAVAAFENALDHDAHYTAAYDHLARTNFKLGRLDDAIDVTVRLRRNAPTPSALAFIGGFRRLISVQRRLLIDPADTLALVELARTAEGLQDDDLAARALERVAGESTARLNELIRIEMIRGNYGRALEHTERLVELDPADAAARQMMRRIHLEADSSIRTVAERLPRPEPPRAARTREEKAASHSVLGLARWEDLDFAAAEREMRRAIRLDERFAEPYVALAQMAEFTGKYDAGLAALGDLHRVLMPEQWETLAGPLERRLTALKALKEAGAEPTAEQLQRVASTYAHGSGLDEERLLYLLRAVEQDPGNADLLWDVALTYQATAQYDRAIDSFQKALAAIEQAGGKPTVRQLSWVGLTYVSARRYDDALDFMLKASAEYPNDTTLLLNIAGCYRMTHELDKAIEYYEKALAIDPANADANRLLDETRAEMTTSADDEAPPHDTE
ncbi:MAG: fused MFS/spermidine synthase [Verrucomicrobia bacterium]|nr:fused MFS/spermidine synthase [Verrucomicrobiota bacterium]